MSSRETASVLARARALQHSALAGTTQPLLRGKNIGLMCEADDAADSTLFRRAASGLGAHVAHIRPSLSELSTPHDVQHTARLLGRLYDAVECQGVAAAIVLRLGDEAGIPVFDGLASAGHPTTHLAGLLGGDAAANGNRGFVVQAVLLGAIT
ncbi:MAG: ornithine carbamoyltransferase [Rubrivivax sp.]